MTAADDMSTATPEPDSSPASPRHIADLPVAEVYPGYDPDLIEPAYDNVSDWVQDWLLPTAERRVADGSQGGIYWCARWWAHPEGLQRIYALWREWEKARVDDTMSIWWRDHLDPHVQSLTSEHGPFVRCSPSRHYPPLHLVAEPIPQAVADLLPEGPASTHAESDLSSTTSTMGGGHG